MKPSVPSVTERLVRQMKRDNARSLHNHMLRAGYPNVRAMDLYMTMRNFHEGEMWDDGFSLGVVAVWLTRVVRELGIRDLPKKQDRRAYSIEMHLALQTLVTYLEWPLELPGLVSGPDDTPAARSEKRVSTGKRLMRLMHMHDLDMQRDGDHHGQAFDDLRIVSRALISWFDWYRHDALDAEDMWYWAWDAEALLHGPRVYHMFQ